MGGYSGGDHTNKVALAAEELHVAMLPCSHEKLRDRPHMMTSTTVEGCLADLGRWATLPAKDRTHLMDSIVAMAHSPELGSYDVERVCQALMNVPTVGMDDSVTYGAVVAAAAPDPDQEQRVDTPDSGATTCGAPAAVREELQQRLTASPTAADQPLDSLFAVVELCACLHRIHSGKIGRAHCAPGRATVSRPATQATMAGAQHNHSCGQHGAAASCVAVAGHSQAEAAGPSESQNGTMHSSASTREPDEDNKSGGVFRGYCRSVSLGPPPDEAALSDSMHSRTHQADSTNVLVSEFAGHYIDEAHDAQVMPNGNDSNAEEVAAQSLLTLAGQCILRMGRYAAEVLTKFAEAASQDPSAQHQDNAHALVVLMDLLHRPSRHLSMGEQLASGEDLKPSWQKLLAQLAVAGPQSMQVSQPESMAAVTKVFCNDAVRGLGNRVHTGLTETLVKCVTYKLQVKDLSKLLLDVHRGGDRSIRIAHRLHLMRACTLHMCLRHIHTVCSQSEPPRKPAHRAHAEDSGSVTSAATESLLLPSTGLVVDRLVDVRNKCIQEGAVHKLPFEIQQYLQAYSRLHEGAPGGHVQRTEQVLLPADHSTFIRRKELCLGRDFRVEMKGTNPSGDPKANQHTGVLVVLVPLYGLQQATSAGHSASAGLGTSAASGEDTSTTLAPQGPAAGRAGVPAAAAPAQMLVAKVFPIWEQTPSGALDFDVVKNLHGAHSEAYLHLCMLAEARGMYVEALRDELLAVPPAANSERPQHPPAAGHQVGSSATAPASDCPDIGQMPAAVSSGSGGQAAHGPASRREVPACHVPALRGVDVCPEPHPDVSHEAMRLRKRVLEGGQISDDDVKKFSKSTRSVWVMEEHLPDGTLADILGAVRELNEGAELSDPCYRMFKSVRAESILMTHQGHFNLLHSASGEWETAGTDKEPPKYSTPLVTDALKHEVASHVAGARAHVNAMSDQAMYRSLVHKDAARQHMERLARVLESIKTHGWPVTSGTYPSDEATLRTQNAFVFWLSWQTKLDIMHDIIRAVAQAHNCTNNRTLGPRNGAPGAANASKLKHHWHDEAFCHADLSLRNVMLRDRVAYLIDWANACMRDPQNPEFGLCARHCVNAEGEDSLSSTGRSMGRACQRYLHIGQLSGAPELAMDKEEHVNYCGTRFLVSRSSSPQPCVSSVPGAESLSDTTTSGNDCTTSSTQLGEPTERWKGGLGVKEVSGIPYGKRCGHDQPAAPDVHVPPPEGLFERHALSDVWMCGLMFCEIIRMEHLDAEPHCRGVNYTRTGGARDSPQWEPMSRLLPSDDNWWRLMPPLFSEPEKGEADVVSWVELWKELRGLILNKMLVHVAERESAAWVLAEMDRLCAKLNAGGPLSRLL
eukprot:jgi/Ulvmu1/12430/UM009_0081.1